MAAFEMITEDQAPSDDLVVPVREVVLSDFGLTFPLATPLYLDVLDTPAAPAFPA